jgi:ribosomal protein L34E
MPTIIFWMMLVPMVVLVQRRPHPQAYCVKEKAKMAITGAHTVTLGNGRKALQGKCSSCGTNLFMIKSNRNPAAITVRRWGTMLGRWLGKIVRRPHPEAYCVKEKATREITGAHTVVLKNGRKALQGKCSSCGTTLFRMKSSRNLAAVAAREWGTMLGRWLGKIVRRPHPEAYCVKEKATREITGAHTVVLKNGRKALQGKCSSCGTTLFRMK